MDTARPRIQQRIEAYSGAEIRFNLMAIGAAQLPSVPRAATAAESGGHIHRVSQHQAVLLARLASSPGGRLLMCQSSFAPVQYGVDSFDAVKNRVTVAKEALKAAEELREALSVSLSNDSGPEERAALEHTQQQVDRRAPP